MLLTAVDLYNAFLANLHRLSRSQVQVTAQYEEKQIVITREFLGAANKQQILQESIDTQLLPEHLETGSAYMSTLDAVIFLNQAWGRLHDTKCRAISSMLSGQQVATHQVDTLLKEHGELFDQSPLYPEESLAEGIFGWNKGKHEVSSSSSRIFIMGKEMTGWGKPTLLNATLEGFVGKVFGGVARPSVSKPVKFVNMGEASAYISLAENSRYSAGLLGRQRVWRKSDGDLYDIVEIFYNEDQGSWLPFWGDKQMFLTMSYIAYPKPLTSNEVLGQDTDGNVLPVEEWRVIECEYGYEIAIMAAAMASGTLKGGEEG